MSEEGTPTISRHEIPGGNLGDLSFNIEELDDEEFNLPAVEVPPTLESILNESDDGSLSDEEFSGQVGLFQETGDTTSIESSGSMSRREEKKTLKSSMYGTHGSVLKHVMLRGVSSQLQKAAEQVNAGKPTAMAVSTVIAVGTFHGLILIFDPEQVLKWCLGSMEYGEQFGSVSCLAFNSTCTRLLAGYSRGQITMWDLTKGKLLRRITDAHPAQNAVLHIKFTDDTTLAICSDSGGSVFELNFRRVMGTRTCETRCIFSGSRGEVCAIEPLRMTPHFKDHPSQEVCLVALGTVTKVIVVTVRPSLRVWFSHALQGDPDTLPVLTWQFVVIQISSSTRIIDPVLAFGRKNVIYFYEVNFGSADKINFVPLQKMDLQYVVQNFTWLNSRVIVTLDTSEHLHVIDVRSEEELEVLDIADVQLVYGSSHFKGLATGGNVSKAMAVAGERACFYSMASFGTQLLLLGLRGIHVMTLRTWNERIEFLARQNMYPEALAMALSFYEDQAKAVTGLPGKKTQRKELIASKMEDLLGLYADQIMTKLCPEHGRIEVLIHHYKETVPLCMQYCLAIDRRNFLFSKLYERFKVDPLAHGVFLESLESYILDGRLDSLTPFIAKEFVNHFADRKLYDTLEACLVRLSITDLDVHQVMKLCWQHGLYDGIIYIYNRGMNDYVTPLEDLLNVLQEAVNRGKQLSDDQIKLGNRLLVYISCCLAGRAYPVGDIPSELVQTVKTDVLKCITALYGKNDSNSTVYPYLKTFLHFDTREFLNVLALAFEEPEFKNEMGMSQKQRIVDILLQIMVKSEGFLPTEVGALFTFLARQMAKQENSIMVNQLLFEQVLEHLTNPGDETRMEERQQALMELLQAGGLSQVNDERVLSLAERAKFYRVCEYLYGKHRQFDKILGCYLQDPSRKPQVFYYIKQVLDKQNLSTKEASSFEEGVIANIEELVDIDNKKTSEILLVAFPSRLQDVVHCLKEKPQNLYHLLQGLFSNPENFCSSPTGNTKDLPNIDPFVMETYIDLMCQYDPSHVHEYIRNTEGYRLEETLEICRKYNILDATAYLLEKAGDVNGAFSIMLEILQSRTKEVTERLLSNGVQIEQELFSPWNRLQLQLLIIIQLCQRNSQKMDQKEREALWFPLLESMLVPQRQLRGRVDQKYLEAFKEMTHHLLNSMMGYISLPTVLQRVVQDPAYNTGKFSEIRELIMSMFETYNYEKTLLSTTMNLLNDDLHTQLRRLCVTANKGYSCHDKTCCQCRNVFKAEPDVEILVFKCGHAYHSNCLKEANKNDKNLQSPTCVKCPQSKLAPKVVSPRIIDRGMATASGDSIGLRPERKRRSSTRESFLNTQQQQALDYFRIRQKSSSRLGLLEELANDDQEKARPQGYYGVGRKYKSHDELEKLNLTPGTTSNIPSEVVIQEA